MMRVIRAFSKLNEDLQEEVYFAYQEGQLERTSFPFKGEIVDGVIFSDTEETYLIPISTIKAAKLSATSDEDKEESVEVDEVDVDDEDEELVDEEE